MRVKVIGAYGQVSLGKEHAGRQVAVEGVRDEQWVISRMAIIPKNELWLHEPVTASALSRSIRRVETTLPHDTDLDALESKLATTELRRAVTVARQDLGDTGLQVALIRLSVRGRREAVGTFRKSFK